MTIYMGQIMAECDCTHPACEQRGYCMAARIEELEAKLAEAEQAGYANAMEAERKLHEGRIEELTAERDEALNQLDSARHSIDVLERRVAELKHTES